MTRKSEQPENKHVVNPTINILEFRVTTGDVIWFQRLVAEDDINCPAGTFDIVCIVNQKNGNIALLFLEGKKPIDRKPSLDDLRFEQRLFYEHMVGKPKTLCVVINNSRQVWPAIKKAQRL